MSTVVWSVTKVALLGTFLGIIGLIPVAAAAYAGWLYCPNLLLAVELAAEACFALYYFFIIAKQLDAMPEQHDPPADYNPQQLVASFLRHMARVDDIQGYLSQWFLDAPYELIRHDNVKELVAFAIFFKTPEQVAQQGLMPQLDALLEQLSAMHNLQLPPGYNPNLKFMSHLWGATPHMYRPLFFYVVMEVIELLCWAILACCGFKRHSVLGCAYYTYGLPDPQQQQQQADKEHQQCKVESSQQQQQQLPSDARPNQQQPGGRKQRQQRRSKLDQQKQQRPAAAATAAAGKSPAAAAAAAAGDGSGPGAAAARVPMVVLHGVGAGLLPYLGVALNLAAAGQPMLLPVWKQVSMRLMRTIPTVDDSVDVVLAALARHGLSSAAVLGHSYGSLVAARLVRLAPEVVHTLAVVDPVCFAMHMPNLVKYFLYSPHASGNAVADAFIALLRSEIHCARNFTRNFFWATINLFDEHLPERTLVVLSGTDLLCPTAYVRDWLEGHTAATVLYHATASHGAGLLLHLPWQCTILNSVLSMVGQPGEAHSAAAAAAAAAAVAETAAAGPDKAAVVAAGNGAAAAAAGAGDVDAAGSGAAHGGEARWCIAAADARVLAEAGCWSDADAEEQFDHNSSCSCDAADAGKADGGAVSAAAAAAGGGEWDGSWGMLGAGGSRLGLLLRSLTGLPSGSDSDAATLDSGSESDSDSEDLSGFNAADWGSSSDGEEAQKRSKEGCAGVDAIADADGSKERSSREGDAGWCDVPGCADAADAAVELELLRDAASSLPGEVKGSGGSLQQQQQQQQQRGGRRQGLVRGRVVQML